MSACGSAASPAIRRKYLLNGASSEEGGDPCHSLLFHSIIVKNITCACSEEHPSVLHEIQACELENFLLLCLQVASTTNDSQRQYASR